MVAAASAEGDHVAFVDSSHGNGDGRGNSYLCLLPDPTADRTTPDEASGSYWDHQLAADLGAGKATTFVFLDACLSGGLLLELVATLPRCFVTSTCSQSGFGYDENASQHGAWTETFLVETLMRRRGADASGGERGLDLVAAFQDAYAAYIRRYGSRRDRPCCGLRVGDRRFNTNDGQEPSDLPRGLLRVFDVFGDR